MNPALALAPLFIPSPSQNVWHLGPLPLRAYAHMPCIHHVY